MKRPPRSNAHGTTIQYKRDQEMIPEGGRVKAIGRRIFRESLRVRGRLRERFKLATMLLRWAVRNEQTKVKLLHFIDVLPTLSDRGVVQHLGEYFSFSDRYLPFVLRLLALTGRAFGSIPILGPAVVAGVTNVLVEKIANSFVAGVTTRQILKVVERLAKKGQTSTLDALGEKVQSEDEAKTYLRSYLDLLEILGEGSNVSLKPSSLYSQFSSVDPEGTKTAVKEKLYPLLRKAKTKGITVNIDMEHYQFKSIILNIFEETLSEEEFQDFDDLGTVIQTYLQDSEEDLLRILGQAGRLNRQPYIRLVKGAYWDYELVMARHWGWPVPVFQTKPETDRNYQKLARLLIDHRKEIEKGVKRIRPAFASHNIRSTAYVIAYAQEVGLPKDEFEFQLLYGMGDTMALALTNMGYNVRIYTPQGELVSGMAYLVRRILENTSSESFLRHLYLEASEIEELLQSPDESEKQERARPREEPKLLERRRATALEKHAERLMSVADRHSGLEEAQIIQDFAAKLISLHRTTEKQVVSTPAEENRYFYSPRGSGVVMVDGETSRQEFSRIIAAPLVAGSELVVYANQSELLPIIDTFNRLLDEAGLVGRLVLGKGDGVSKLDDLEYDWVFCSVQKEKEWAIRRSAGVTRMSQRSVRKVITQVGPDYLKEFLLPGTVTINLMRKGFAPELGESARSVQFANLAPVDFAKDESHRLMDNALEGVESEIEKGVDTCPLVINGEKVVPASGATLRTINPTNPEQVVGTVFKAGVEEAERAVAAARDAFLRWKEVPVTQRANLLRRAGGIMRSRRFELAAWMILEVGKVRVEALGDVDESIDYLFYYAGEMERLAKENEFPARTDWKRQPQGVVVTISPWNFPLAILTGMTAAAVVAGNTVIMKPAEQSPLIAAKLMEILEEAGLPPGVVNYLPGMGEEVGAHLVRHLDVDMIAFTGSEEVGLEIVEESSKVEKETPKAVIAEMGGKNAIIIDESADLDDAVPGAVASFLGYSNQKCSACSRVIVHHSRYEEFVGRLKSRVESTNMGDPRAKATTFGPLIDEQAKGKVESFISQADEVVGKAKWERANQNDRMRRLELRIPDPPGRGYYVKPVVYINVPPDVTLAQEEVFGPVLCVMEARDFEEALHIANQTRYGLTGGIYSRTPSHIQEAIDKFMVGNLYINRKITGAIVCRQPFGGFFHSGIGSKAGGPDYLPQFMKWEHEPLQTDRTG